MSRAFVPHDYQKQMIEFIGSHKRCAVWAAMGAGKTVTTLTALDALSMSEDVYPAIVLAPLRVSRISWPDEIAKWASLNHLTVSVITSPSPEKRKRAVAKNADIYFCNYDILPWLLEHLKEIGREWPYKTVVADEATRLKSFRLRQGSKRAKALSTVAHEYCDRFIELTGTPSPNGLRDLWGQVWFLDKGERLGRTFSAFEMRWFRKGYDGFSMIPMPHAQKEIEEKLADICLTVKGLPVDEPIYNDVYIELPKRVVDLYTEFERAMFAELSSGDTIEAVNAAVRTMRCLQLANGAIYVNDKHDWETVHDAKLDALDSIIAEANGAPVLVAYHFKSDLERLRYRYPKGRTLDADPDTVKAWNAGRIPLLFVHPASAGHGLNLAEGGNILAFFSVNWNLEEYMQVIERIGPLRQKQAGFDRPVIIHHILARDTVDEIVLDRLKSKKSVQEVLLEAMRRKHIIKETDNGKAFLRRVERELARNPPV